MKYHYFSFALGFAVFALPASIFSQTVLTGDHVIEPGVTDSGSLTVSGGVLVEGGDIHLGGLANGYAPLVLHYMENGLQRQMVVYAAQSAVEYLWKEGGNNSSSAQAKMSLGADNTLSLYDASSTPRIASITLSPATGEISASGGIRLADNTLISGSESLRSTALYNSLGQKIAEVDEDGVLLIKKGIAAGTNAEATGVESFAFGEDSVASGMHSFSAGGIMGMATGSESFVGSGVVNLASGSASSVIGGAYNIASGTLSVVAGGIENSAIGESSSVIGGEMNRASADHSSVIGGISNRALHFASYVLGGSRNQAEAAHSAIISGMDNRTLGSFSYVFGRNSRAQATNSVVLGRGNVLQGDSLEWVPSDDLFVIGNGHPTLVESDRSNAFVVHKNGVTRSAGLIESQAGVRVPPSGDIPMGAFTAGSNPATMNAGLRYSGE